MSSYSSDYSPAPPGSEPDDLQYENPEVKRLREEMWRQQMVAQQNSFLTLAGLELAVLTIYATLDKSKPTPLFIATVVLVIVQVTMTILLINAERETAWGNPWYKAKRGRGYEKTWRWVLMVIIFCAWLSLAALLIL
ncbi:MAG: hypothetical protein WEC84_04555 [Candidatus Andersenbacteria bacterium]